uniref:Uncharacterized protein n=1 Tax=Glossina morsitans morsitans TaxID=37546 RepID=A0A1B0FHZ2_GLOMM
MAPLISGWSNASDREQVGRPSTQNIRTVRRSFVERLGTSIGHRSNELDILISCLQAILTKDLLIRAYKVELTQETSYSHQMRSAALSAADEHSPDGAPNIGINWHHDHRHHRDHFRSLTIGKKDYETEWMDGWMDNFK